MIANYLKLNYSAASPNSRRVRIFLVEKGPTVTLMPVNIVVQQTTRHGWRGKGQQPLTIALVTRGATR